MRRDEALAILRVSSHELGTPKCGDLAALASVGVRSIALFGLVARDQATKSCAADPLVDFGHPIGLLDVIGWKQPLEALRGRQVDLVPRDRVQPRLRHRRWSPAGEDLPRHLEGRAAAAFSRSNSRPVQGLEADRG